MWVDELCHQDEVARCQLGRAEGAQMDGVAVFRQQQCTVEGQPELQWSAEQPAQQLEVAYLSEALPAVAFERSPVPGRRLG